MLFTIGCISRHLFVCRIEKLNIFYLQRIELVRKHDKQALDNMAALYRIIGLPDMGQTFLRTEQAEFTQCPFQGSKRNRFQQIIDAADLESLQCILIISGCKDNRSFDLYLLKYFKSGAVRQMDIHKNDIRLRSHTEISHTFFYTFQLCDDIYRDHRVLCQYRFQGAYRSRFIFYYYCIHTI